MSAALLAGLKRVAEGPLIVLGGILLNVVGAQPGKALMELGGEGAGGQFFLKGHTPIADTHAPALLPAELHILDMHVVHHRSLFAAHGAAARRVTGRVRARNCTKGDSGNAARCF